MIIRIIATALVSVLLSISLKSINKEFSFLIGIVSGALILIFIFKDYADVLQRVFKIAADNNIPLNYIKLVLKVIGIGYLCEFTTSVAKDAGETAIASYIEFSSKIIIMIISFPVFIDLVNTITNIIP